MNRTLSEERRPVETMSQSIARSPHCDGNIPHMVGKALLIVDDEPMMTDLLCTVVEGKGYKAFTAHSGEAALRLYAAHPDSIAMVITDLSMPRMSGSAMIEAMQRLDPEVRILIVSGSCSPGDEKALRQQGVQSVLHKPFHISQLFRQIQEILTEPCSCRSYKE